MKTMKMTVWMEGMVLLGTGIMSIAEGLRLARKIDPDAISDVLGPGYYIVFLGLILITTGMTYGIIHCRDILHMEKGGSPVEVKEQKGKRIVFPMVIVLILYLILINIAGYLVPTLLFFFLEFRLAGVESWKRNVLLTLAVTAVFYLIFIQYCHLVFPRGLFFK